MADRRVVLVTGATGFLGRWSIAPLLGRGFEVHASGTRATPPAELAGATYHRINVLDGTEVEACLAAVRPSHLLHFAWNATPGSYWTDPDNHAWLSSSLYLARRFQHHGGTRLVVAGTCAEYDWSVAAHCREGETPTVLDSATCPMPYALCKAALHLALDAVASQGGLSVGWGRVFFQFGPYEPPRRLVPAIITALLAGQPALCTHGRQQRSFLYSPDVGSAFAALVDSALSGPVNIGAEEVTTIGQLAQRIGALMGRPDLIQLGAREAPAGEPAVLVPDVARLREELGWRPAVALDDGLERTIAWWRDKGSMA